MLRRPMPPRPHWQTLAREYGFHFHTLYGEPYWDESACYQFSLEQIEQALEAPTAELHQMCLEVVDRVVRDEALLTRFQIPAAFHDAVARSWLDRDASLYSRLDFAYSGEGPAKLLENNADTPTSLYETGFWQWLWLEQQVDSGALSRQSDQFNSLQEQLIARFAQLAVSHPGERLHMACCKDTVEDRGTVQYLQDCAAQAGVPTAFVYVEDIGVTEAGQFVDLAGRPIHWLFKLYPWEFMQREAYGPQILSSQTTYLEPLWKTVLSNKALLVMLWQLFPGHPNLLPAFFEGDAEAAQLSRYVRKPLYSREGANIDIVHDGQLKARAPGPYGAEGYIVQAWHPLPRFGDSYTLIGAWLVDDQPAGISVREDHSPITQDLSRFLPHIIL